MKIARIKHKREGNPPTLAMPDFAEILVLPWSTTGLTTHSRNRSHQASHTFSMNQPVKSRSVSQIQPNRSVGSLVVVSSHQLPRSADCSCGFVAAPAGRRLFVRLNTTSTVLSSDLILTSNSNPCSTSFGM